MMWNTLLSLLWSLYMWNILRTFFFYIHILLELFLIYLKSNVPWGAKLLIGYMHLGQTQADLLALVFTLVQALGQLIMPTRL